jgi:hypothetical protein
MGGIEAEYRAAAVNATAMPKDGRCRDMGTDLSGKKTCSRIKPVVYAERHHRNTPSAEFCR